MLHKISTSRYRAMKYESLLHGSHSHYRNIDITNPSMGTLGISELSSNKIFIMMKYLGIDYNIR